jgi:hypothetical protein
MMKKIEWELLASEGLTTSRLKVPSGWIIKYESGDAASMVFVPDPKHEWKL